MPAPQNIAVNNTVHRNSADSISPHCFHCLEPLPKFCNITADVGGLSRPMCCYGCKAVAEFIQGQELSKFYTHRRRSGLSRLLKSGNGRSSSTLENEDWSHLDKTNTASEYVILNDDGSREMNVQVHGLYCSSCSWLINKALKRLSNDIELHVELDAKRIHITVPNTDSSIKLSALLELISRLGYQPSPISLSQDVDDLDALNIHEKRQFIKRILVSGLGMMQVMTYAVALYLGEYKGMDESHRQFLTLVSMLVATVVVFYAGKPFFQNAFNDLRNRHFGMDVPIALAIGGAYFPSVYNTLTQIGKHVYFDSAVMFIFFLTIGRFIEMRARHHLSSGSAALMRLLPKRIEVERFSDGHSFNIAIPPQCVQLRDRLLLRNGQVVPFDARVRSGHASLDESLLTGEARAVSKKAGDHLLAGSKLHEGSVSVEATNLWQNSSIVKIERLLQTGRTPESPQRSSWQNLSQIFVITVLLLTVLVGGFWWFYQAERAFDIILAMLIASCPCAFALATPVGQAAASHALRQSGILLAKPNVLKLVPQISNWCFDKTGTLTQGRASISRISALTEVPENECLQLMAALERKSQHVMANAFSVIETKFVANNIREFPGRGLTGIIDGELYYIGKLSWVAAKIGAQADEYKPELPSELSECVLANERRLLAIVAISDDLRDGSEEYLKFLRSIGSRSTILSGDTQGAVDGCTQRLPIDKAIGNLLPAQKLDYLNAVQAQGEKIAMLGDGVNDAPSLSQADLSIALSSGSELSQSQADIILLNGRLDRLIKLHDVAKKTQRITQQNLIWALAYNLAILPLAASGFLTPWLAAIGMSTSSLIVVLNALRIRGASER